MEISAKPPLAACRTVWRLRNSQKGAVWKTDQLVHFRLDSRKITGQGQVLRKQSRLEAGAKHIEQSVLTRAMNIETVQRTSGLQAAHRAVSNTGMPRLIAVDYAADQRLAIKLLIRGGRSSRWPDHGYATEQSSS